jgi:hypothetical protein
MLSRLPRLALFVSLAAFAADEPGWKTKQVADWTPDEAQQVLRDSPWVKTTTPAVTRPSNQGQGQRGFGGFGIPGMGGGRRGGYPGGGYPNGGNRQDDGLSNNPPMLKLRWESALPVREAELKTRDEAAPTIDQDHYAIAVYGVPSRLANGDPQKLADQYKKDASLKRDGKKDLKPSSVEVLERENGPVVVYFFPRTKEISADDRRVEFDAKIGRLEVTESFFTEDMNYQGKLEL